MKSSTQFLSLLAVIIAGLAIYKLAGPSFPPPDLNAPRFVLAGRVQRRVPEGVIVEVRREAVLVSSGTGSYVRTALEGENPTRALLRGNPGQDHLVDGDKVDVQAVENGVYQQNGETLRAYWYVATAAPNGAAPVPPPAPVFSNPLEDSAKRVGHWHHRS